MGEEKASAAGDVLLGGQAVIEGVMMRGPRRIATAVRRSDGRIVVRSEEFVPLARKVPVFRLPVLRGAAGMVEMMTLGMKALNYSAEAALADADPAQKEATGHKEGGTADVIRLALTVMVSLVLAAAVFFVTPLALTALFFSLGNDPLLFNLTAGSIRLVIFLGYLVAIARIPDVRRLFMYHGAEHMTVFAYERGKTLAVEAAARQSRFHPRCGTSFLLIVMVVSILLFAILDTLVLGVLGSIPLGVRLVTHLLVLPVVAGASYEVIRFAARHGDSLLGRWVSAPGLWLQRLTTREPDATQLEVAVAALGAALSDAEEDAMTTGDLRQAATGT